MQSFKHWYPKTADVFFKMSQSYVYDSDLERDGVPKMGILEFSLRNTNCRGNVEAM